MSQLKIDCVQDKGRIGFRTETGFALMRGVCSVATNRGESRSKVKLQPAD